MSRGADGDREDRRPVSIAERRAITENTLTTLLWYILAQGFEVKISGKKLTVNDSAEVNVPSRHPAGNSITGKKHMGSEEGYPGGKDW